MQRIESHARLVPRGQQTVVIKVGTSSLLRDDKRSLNLSSLAGICETVRELRDQGGCGVWAGLHVDSAQSG
jgi:hypothetical protein